MQIREDAFSQPGGDTFVMKSLSRELAALGVHVDIDVEGNADPRKYDLVHLHNMVVPTGIQKQAQKCVEFKVPYVVTALQEDWYAFFNKMIAHGESLIAYFNKVNEVTIDSVMEYLSGKHFDKLPDAHFVARYAEAVFASGIQEKLNINEFYPFCKRVEICHFGSSVGAIADSGELFYKEYGIKDFIFCVGRLECKKNQLSLLKAFEDSSIPIVFAGGGKMVQEHYENAARKVQRKGKTLFLERISAEMLASAYAASRVHAMPSWWELPGLVSLEAALYGTQVVGVEGGTLSDYLGNSAFYCKPDSPEDIRKVVTEAYHAEVSPLLKTRASMFTWKRSAEEHLNIYETVLGRVHRQAEKPISKNVRTIESRSQLSS